MKSYSITVYGDYFISQGSGSLLNSQYMAKLMINNYTKGSTNIAVAGMAGPQIESMYFLLKNGGILASYVS